MQSCLLSPSLYCCAMKWCIRGIDMFVRVWGWDVVKCVYAPLAPPPLSTPLCVLVILATDIFPNHKILARTCHDLV